VDAVGTLDARRALPDGSTRMTFTAPASVLRHVVEKGSITVDGISLTVASLDDSPDDANPNDGDRNDANPNRAGSTFDVAVIPHTLAVTTLGAKQPGDPVNLEVDVLAKYVERLLTTHSSQEH
jgi:riboflavin synthase